MTDFDALIDDYGEVEGIFAVVPNSLNHNRANKSRSALCEAIDAVVKERDDFESRFDTATGVIKEMRERVLEAHNELKEADADAERLARPELGMLGKYHCRFCDGWGYDFEGEENVDHAPDCPVTLHVARLSKRGQV